MSIDSVSYREIRDTDDLARSCERWRTVGAVALDTEFARERTFYPALGLVQLSDGRENVLIDPLEIEDLSPLADLLTAPQVIKTLHSCGEDIEVLHHHLGVCPSPVFDTQVAAAMAGLDWSMGYGRLVETISGVSLPKAQTRSNWLRRPLSSAQKRYAALDVAYLLECYEHLRNGLEERRREEWLEEDCARLTDPARFRIDDQAVYRKIARGRRLRKHQLVVLRDLTLWREQQARDRNLPRSFVLKEAALGALALKRPGTMDELRKIKELDARDVRRHGRALLRLIAEARARPMSEHPEPIPPPLDLRPYKEVVDTLRQEIRALAEQLEVPPELLAGKRQAEALVRLRLKGSDAPLPKALQGWRREVVGLPLLEKLRRELPDVGL